MSFRISVESVIYRHLQDMPGEVLLVKRASDCRVAPNVWNVPAGKVDFLERTYEAVVRETSEETGLKVKVVQLLSEDAFEIRVGDDKAYRNMFTYLTQATDNDQEVKLNKEHTQFKWVTEKEIHSEEYASLMPRLKQIILEVFKSHE
ncbi:putative nudix hydrolase [Candidatus Protochlamydia naegleriophila]|uniref:Putative nudix hydrolase n=2 Tax=Candidatus Protochlamydia naegleriophila TaxID=389348 RepID=A0A0U5JEZ7_9BACT|nr:putative nudix hydrolase [Candidatus Protochlamydia naegleriophila]